LKESANSIASQYPKLYSSLEPQLQASLTTTYNYLQLLYAQGHKVEVNLPVIHQQQQNQ
jgi:hypothetical protein